MIKLTKILKEMYDERAEKTILTSRPSQISAKRFKDLTKETAKLFNGEIKEKNIAFNMDNESTSMFKPSMIANVRLTQHIGEYKGDDFKDFTKRLAKIYEDAGFKVVQGFGMDEIKGFEVKDQDNEIVGEVDFLEKGAIPNHGHTVIIKQKSNEN